MRTITNTFIATVTLAAGATIAVAPHDARAETSAYGVDHVDLTTTPRFCPSPGGALPPGYGGAIVCGPGEPSSNTIYVEQVQLGDGWAFADLVGTGATSDDVWIPATFSAQCSGLRTLVHASVALGSDNWGTGAPPEVTGWWSQSLPVDETHRTIPGRNLDLDVPVLDVSGVYFESLGPVLAGTPTSFVARGEQWVADQVAAGTPEEVARQQSWSEVVHVDLGGTVGCSGVTERFATDPETTPIEIVYLGVGESPGEGWRDATIDPPTPARELDAGSDLAAIAQVTQATLSVLEDPTDPCRLLLSGVVTTNQPMSIDYRFVDELGVASQVFTVEVDHTQVAFLDHHVDLEPAAPLQADGGPTDLVAGGRDGDLQLTAADTDRAQGIYHLEVVAPHALVSDGASYNVGGCTTEIELPTTRS